MGAKDNESRLEEEESRSKGLGGEKDQQQQLKRKEDQNRRQRACRERKRRARQLLREAHQQQQQQQPQPHRGGQEEEEGQQQQQRQQHQAPVQVATTQAEEERRKISSSSSVAVVVKVEKSPGEKLRIESSGPQAVQQVDPIAQKSYAQRKKEDQNRRQRECRERKRRSQELENREKQKRAQQELLSELGKVIREPHLGGGATEVMGHHQQHQQSKAVQVVEGESTSMERSASERAKELAPILHELTAGNGVEYQKLTLAKLLQQPLLQPVLPTFVSELDKGVRHAH